MIRSVSLLLSVALSAAVHASPIPVCSSSESEQSNFLQSRVQPMANVKPLAANEAWVLLVGRDPEGSALKLRAFCQAHPRVPLAIAFQTLFNGD